MFSSHHQPATMSTSAAVEPPTTAKVVIHTTLGPIEIELWAKECPETCRLFLQACLDGVYIHTEFDRVVPGFLIQTGAPQNGTVTSELRNEYHTRLKFNRRGLVGMVNLAENNPTRTKFFITLGPTPELSNRNTLFGRVMGDTIYNVAQMGEALLGEGERPLYPALITRTEVLVKYFDDLIAAPSAAALSVPLGAAGPPPRKPKRPRVKLSFGEEIDAEEPPLKIKMRSAHDILTDAKLSRAAVPPPPALVKIEAPAVVDGGVSAVVGDEVAASTKNTGATPSDEKKAPLVDEGMVTATDRQAHRLKALEAEYERLKQSPSLPAGEPDLSKRVVGTLSREQETLAMLRSFQVKVPLSLGASHPVPKGPSRLSTKTLNLDHDSDYEFDAEETAKVDWKSHRLEFA